MMMYYQELTLLSQIEVPLYFLWGKVYGQLHLAFVELKDSNEKIPVGISFPEYRSEPKKGLFLGSKIRIFAQDESLLQQLDIAKRLSHLTDYVHLTGVREVPTNRVVKYAQYCRRHIKGNSEKLAKRRAKRHGISLEEARKDYEMKDNTPQNELPFIRLKSLTTQNLFPLCIEKRECGELIQDGFGTYGLSSISSVPEF